MGVENNAVLCFSLLFAVLSTFTNIYTDAATTRVDHDISSTDASSRTELFTVHQHTQLVRRRRDAINHVEFPFFMEFTFHFEDKELHMRLKRNEYMTSDIKLVDENGPIQHDLGRKTGIYSDVVSRAAFIVQCEDHQEHCTLRGGLDRNGTKWDVSPETHTPKLHKAVESRSGFTFAPRDSVPAPGAGSNSVHYHTKGHGSRTNQTVGSPRQKRAIPDCDIVECLAIVDETIWAYYLAKNGQDAAAAQNDLVVEYLALYNQADLHYDFIEQRRPGACLRIYLIGISIQTTTAASWSVRGEVDIPLEAGVFVNSDIGLFDCGAQGNALRNSASIDLIQCFTRKNIVFNEGVANGPLFLYHRSVAYDSTCCIPGFAAFNSAVIEGYGDKVELLIAHEIAHGLDAEHDSEVGCSDDDSYIMSNEVVIREDDLKLKNIWYFSTCSLDLIFTYIDAQPKCLRDNGFTEAQYDNFKEQPLAGAEYSWDDQCVSRFGLQSTRCDPTGQNRTFFPDMCDRGIFCTEEAGACTGQGRPYDGTPCGDFDAYCVKGDCFAPPRQLDITCEVIDDCNDTNAVCDPESATCQCKDGFYDDNGSDVGGTCVQQVIVGEPCPEDDACLDPNAFCDVDVCVCKDGYYEVQSNGSCALQRSYGETCTAAGDCKGNNIECSGSPATCRCPSGTYIDEASGDCLTVKELGGSCEEGQCGPVNSACDNTTNTCRCLDGYYDDNGADAGGGCAAKVPLDASCTQPDACLDPNAECSSMTCSCLPDFYNNGSACDPKRSYGETCTAAGDCKGNNIECSGSPATCRCPSGTYIDETSGDCLTAKALDEACETGQCGPTNSQCDSNTNTCRCLDGYYDDNGANAAGNCAPKAPLDDPCTQPDACLDPNAECAMTCSCLPDFYNNGGTCEPKKAYGETCTATGDCLGDNIECSGSPATCRCPSGTYIDTTSGNCVAAKALDEACETGQCGPTNSQCDSNTNTCRCLDGYYDDNGANAAGNCAPKVPLDDPCTQPDACLDPNAECAMTCSCLPDFYNNGGTCEPKKAYGETCTATGDCLGDNIECSGTPATCRCPSGTYIDTTSGNCVTAKALDEACETGQCGPTNSQCDSNTNTCRCLDGYYDDNGANAAGNCAPKVALDASCSQPDACSDPNAECSSATCSCLAGYYNNGVNCVPLKCIGESCTAVSECKGASVECSGSPTTCRCPSGRYLDETTGDCALAKDLNENCEPGQCGAERSFCDTLTQTCLCQEGFVNDNGNCTTRGDFSIRELGETCENTRECIDSNATCSGALGTCQCRDDFYDDTGSTIGGTCQPKVVVGENCPQADACLDVNAVCDAGGVCGCPPDYYVDGDKCELLKSIGENCTFPGECRGGDVDCTGTIPTCRCPSDRYLDVTSGNCVTDKALGEGCEAGQCGPANSYCDSTGTCVCQCGFFEDAGNCTEKIALDGACTDPVSCSDPNAICSTLCYCGPGFVNDNGICVVNGTGSLGSGAGQSCSNSAQCLGDNMVCAGSPQTCRCPDDYYFDFNSGNCVLKLPLGADCEPGQCAGNAICNRKSRTCACAKGSTFNGNSCSRCLLPFVEFGNSCYLFGSVEVTYKIARKQCNFFDKSGSDSNLVQIDSIEELNFVKNFMKRRLIQPNFGYWNDLFETELGVATWRTSGDPLVVSDWAHGEPDDYKWNQSCTMFLRWRGYKQGDVECFNGFYRKELDVRTGFKLCEIKLH